MNIIEIFTEILFPKKATARKLEAMSVGEILNLAAKAEVIEKTNLTALFRYHDPLVKKIVWEIKYRGNTKLAHVVGKLLFEKILHTVTEQCFLDKECFFSEKSFDLHEKILIIPIPISRRRLKHRGFSQTELIVEAVLKNIPEGLSVSFAYCPDILMKIKETPPQSSLGSRSTRLSNLSSAFALANNAFEDVVRGKNIILIDDVITTGATMKEVSGTLIDAGAKSVFCFAIAH